MEAAEPKKQMSYSIDFKQRAIRKLTEIEIDPPQEFNVLRKGPHLGLQGDSLKGACATKCSKFDFEKFNNSA